MHEGDMKTHHRQPGLKGCLQPAGAVAMGWMPVGKS